MLTKKGGKKKKKENYILALVINCEWHVVLTNCKFLY